MERYLVTGGAGFIGSHIVETLARMGHFVRVVDNFDTGTRDNLRGMAGEVELIEGTIEDLETARRAVAGIDFVFHEAARGSVPRSVADPLGTHNTNVTGTLNILLAARDNGVKRVVCASSSSVYGETPELPKVETMTPTPLSPYATSKWILEYYCDLFSQCYQLETVALRYFNVYGARQNPNLQYAAVIPIFIRNMLLNKPCVIYGDGGQTRDFTYIEDCVQANLLACKAPGVSGMVFNIACGQQTSVNQLFDFLKTIVPNNLDPVHEEIRAGDVRHSLAGISKAKQYLGFEPKVTLEEGLKKTVHWYKKELLV